ncbi:MAG: SRPBCC family protein [Planctomycetota bacterium]|nr:SRPBCC family protein [Planctomycetota bacterium]
MPVWNVQKSIEIDAPVSKVYELVSDYRNWTTWSPWLIAEPQTKVDISDRSNQAGSTYHWSGTVVGEGKLEHVRLEQDRLVEAQLSFLRPQKAVCKTDFKLEPIGDRTRFIWSIDGNLPWYLFFLTPMIKTMVGMDYQRGLTMIAELAETGSITSSTEVLGVVSIPAIRVAGFQAQSSVFSIQQSMEETLGKLASEYLEMGMPQEGAMVAVYTRFEVKQGIFEYLLGRAIPDSLLIPTQSKLKEWKLPKGRALHVGHTGS